VLNHSELKRKGAKFKAADFTNVTLLENYTATVLDEPVVIPAGTTIIDGYVMRPRRDANIAISTSGTVTLTHAEWRQLKFHIDELFIEQNQMPWGEDDDPLEEAPETTEQ
jgi:hypothetical protein